MVPGFQEGLDISPNLILENPIEAGKDLSGSDNFGRAHK